MFTKTGARMNTDLKERLIVLLSTPEHEGKTQKQIAHLLNVSTRTVQNYLTKEIWKEVHKRRLEVINHSIRLVDQAVYAKALKGDMTAARILYNRWDQVKNMEEVKNAHKTYEEDEMEIKRLEKQIQELENEQNKNSSKQKA